MASPSPDETLTEGEVQELLRREQAGNLSDSAKAAMADMRKAGSFPGPFPQHTLAQRIVRESALPIIGGALGGAAGTIAAPFTAGIANPVTGAMAGSALGEVANQQLGITDPSLLNIGISGAAPAIPGVIRGVANQLPGAAAGLQKSLQSTLGTGMEKVLAMVAPQRAASELWQQVMSSGRTVQIATNSLKSTLGDMAGELEKLVLPAGAAGKLVKGLSALVADGEGTKFVPLDQFRTNMVQLGRIVRSLEAKGGPSAGQAKQLYKAMWADLNAAVDTAAPEVKSLLGAAVDATKREAAEDFLKDAVTKSVSYRLGTRQVDTNGLLTKIERNKDLLEKWLPAEDIQSLKDTLIPWAKKTPQMPSAIPRSTGDKMFSMVTGAETISRLLMSPAGREAIRAMQTPTFDAAVNSILQGGFSGTGMKNPSSVNPLNPMLQGLGAPGLPQ